MEQIRNIFLQRQVSIVGQASDYRVEVDLYAVKFFALSRRMTIVTLGKGDLVGTFVVGDEFGVVGAELF